MRLFYILLFFLVPALFPHANGQGEVGIIAGISNYQGDLSSVSTANGFKALIGPVFGFHSGYQMNARFQFRADLMYTRIAGDDALNEKPETKLRNLDFFAPVFQFATGVDWNIFGLKEDEKKLFTPYLSLGASLFYFNPKTEYEGQKIALHPLGTEGQYLEDYPEQKPYDRFQPTIQFGGGLKLIANDHLNLALEAMMSYTFTDYLDDVSTIYITYPELLAKAGPLTAALANRQGEYFGTEPVVVPTGLARANSISKDLFGVITIRASTPIKIEISQFKIRRHNNNKKMDCPKF